MKETGLLEADKEVEGSSEGRGRSQGQGAEDGVLHIQRVSCLNQERSGETSEPRAAHPDLARVSLDKMPW